MECLGPSTRMHKDCIEIRQLLEKKLGVYKSHLGNSKSIFKMGTLRNVRSTLQTKLRQMQDTWLSKKADEIQEFSDRNDMKRFYERLKEVYGPTISGSMCPLLNADGSSLITGGTL